MHLGYTALVLHAHLPFVRHPEHDDFLEERWLFEAVTECYLPLLLVLERLQKVDIPFRMTISFSPTLMAMLDDPLLRDRCQRYLRASLDLVEREVASRQGQACEPVIHFYRHRLRKLYRRYTEVYNRDLLSGFQYFARRGYLELITCAATHGFLPLLRRHPETVRAQIEVAVDTYRRRFGNVPRGLWLPEMGYYPGLDRILRDFGLQYAFVETHALTHADAGAPYGPYSHAWTSGGLAIFGRDAHSSKQVWSAHEGYPGDFSYRDFYRDIGFECHRDYLGAMAGPPDVQIFTGLKYHRVTGSTQDKELYDRWTAEQTATRHASHFIAQRRSQLERLSSELPAGPPPIVVAPFDAELFGHWWFEGPDFIEHIARQRAWANADFRFITPGDYLDMHHIGQGQADPVYSSWGFEGYADFWCDGSNHWIYRHLHTAGKRMVGIERSIRRPFDGDQTERAIKQAARELLLAQASDWPFIMRTGTASNYAQKRFKTHVSRFSRLATDLEHGHVTDPQWLAQVEAADNIFPDIQPGLYSAR